MPLLTIPIHEHGTPGEPNYPHGAGAVSCGPKGQCFRNAANWVRTHEGSTLVHGKVTNAAGKILDHAWVEAGGDVIDPTQGVRMARDRWYRLVKAQPEAKYTSEHAMLNMLRTKNLGPWTDEEVGKRKLREFNQCHDRKGQFCSTGDEPWTMTKEEFIKRRGADAPLERDDFARYHLSKVSAGEPGLSVEHGTLDGKPIRKVVYRNASGVPIGVTTLRTAAGEKVIDDTAVHPEYRRKGIATQLYRKAAELGHTTGWAENVGSAGVKHKLAVTDALRAGRAVPDRVLDDYPDLRRRKLREFNPCHNPAGPGGGRFCSSLLQGGVGEWVQQRSRITTSRRATKSAMRPATDAERRKLAIPPKYANAMVAVDPKAELRATAITPAGKTASYYSKSYTERQEAAKWSRVMALQRVMPTLVEKIDRDSTSPTREDYHAAMTLRLIALTGLRNGGEGKGEKESFGASSLLLDHVSVAGDSVRLAFPGKSGVEQDLIVTDTVLAGYVRSRQAMGAGELFPHDSADTLKYMKKISGGRFKVHDLRTWNGTVRANQLVNAAVKAGLTPKNKKQFKALRKQVATEVSKALGNSPSIALATYIHPAVFRPLEL